MECVSSFINTSGWLVASSVLGLAMLGQEPTQEGPSD